MKKCRYCGAQHNRKTKLCDSCSKRARDGMATRRAERKAKGMCVTCGINDSLSNILRCQNCKDTSNARNLLRRKEYLAAGKCEKCGKDKSDVLAWHHKWCAYCQLRYKFAHKGTRSEATNIINTLLEKQSYKCALTGRDLHNNKFHIDHIVPKSKGGINAPKNWQIIVEEANVFKTDLSMEEIISLAKDIASNFKSINI